MLPSKRFWIQSFFVGLLALTATAQKAPADRDAVDPQTYVVRPNDVLLITVRPHSPGPTMVRKFLRTSEMTVRRLGSYSRSGQPTHTIRFVSEDGTIVLPTIRPVKAEGLTLAQLRTQLANALSIEETDLVVDRYKISEK